MWLARQPSGYRPQPYGQLARALRDHDPDVGAIDAMMIADENARWHESGLGWGERECGAACWTPRSATAIGRMRGAVVDLILRRIGRDDVRMGLSGDARSAHPPTSRPTTALSKVGTCRAITHRSTP